MRVQDSLSRSSAKLPMPALEIRGPGRLEALAARELEPRGMKRHALERGITAVVAVAEQRMAERRQVQPDLVPAPREGARPTQERPLAQALALLEKRRRGLSAHGLRHAHRGLRKTSAPGEKMIEL